MIKLGIINIMPNPEGYAIDLERLFDSTNIRYDVKWLRLKRKIYSSIEASNLEKNFEYLDGLSDMDALILTGAPIETLAFEEVSYWSEIEHIVRDSMCKGVQLFGFCWGALAIAQVLGVGKTANESKFFGFYPLHKTMEESGLTLTMPSDVAWPFSTWAKFNSADVKREISKNRIKAIFKGDESIDFPVISTTDEKVIMCLAHPEYSIERLRHEDNRDKSTGSAVYQKPIADLQECDTFWADSAALFFQSWMHQLLASKPQTAHHM